MSIHRSISLLIAAGLLLSQGAIRAQGPGDEPDMSIDAATRETMIEGALKKLNDNYVFPETHR